MTAEPTVASVWSVTSGSPMDDDLVQWPPDVFAFTDVVLDRAEAYRFAVSPPPTLAWPPEEGEHWSDTVGRVAMQWCRATGSDARAALPEIVRREWRVVRGAAATPIDELATGRAWRLCVALLTLHAVADEACAGVGARFRPAGRDGIAFRARARERLARRGSMARVDPSMLRVLPKYRTPSRGMSVRSISRYACVTGPTPAVEIHRVAGRRTGADHGRWRLLLLPWPLQVGEGDFRPVRGSVRRRPVEPYGYFEFGPAESLDVALVDRLLQAARRDVGEIDMVVLPESAVAHADIERLESVLGRHRVPMLVTGVRSGADDGGPYGSNWVHLGVSTAGRWWHFRQDKHHRWSLEPSQIAQYHLDRVLDPGVRWWEAIEVRRRSLQIVERDDGLTMASLVCEDLAHVDEVMDLLREVGPALIVSLLLDGPQLASRWTARYASMLVEDPGSAVLTLSSYGMVRRAWSAEHGPSSVVALWKDGGGGTHELVLDDGAQGLLVTATWGTALRRAADGRLPEATAVDLRLSEARQLRATSGDTAARRGPAPTAA
jgi:hypothetical protein